MLLFAIALAGCNNRTVGIDMPPDCCFETGFDTTDTTGVGTGDVAIAWRLDDGRSCADAGIAVLDVTVGDVSTSIPCIDDVIRFTEQPSGVQGVTVEAVDDAGALYAATTDVYIEPDATADVDLVLVCDCGGN
jgi:hypothetical protein